LGWLRVWGVVASAAFLAYGVAFGPLFFDRPLSIALTLGGMAAAACASSFVVMTAYCQRSFLNDVRVRAALERGGFRSFWPAGEGRAARGLGEQIVALVRGSSYAGAVDVTGEAVLSKTPGTLGSAVYSALATVPDVPVSLLLMSPAASAFDPESRQLTVLQSVLFETEISHPAFERRQQATLGLVDELNEKRPDSAKIAVRFYNEKPTFTGLCFDGGMLVAPWRPHEGPAVLALVAGGDDLAERTFFDVFQQQFNRLWGNSIAFGAVPAAAPAPGSAVIRRSGAQKRKSIPIPAKAPAAAAQTASAAAAP
jgi:hypothetical protein